MLGGRDFSEPELAPGSGARVAIIDDALAEELWPGEDALGRLIQFLDADGQDARQPIMVVGVIPAVKQTTSRSAMTRHPVNSRCVYHVISSGRLPE